MISALLVSDVSMWHETLPQALQLTGRLQVVARAETHDETLAAFAQHQPDVVLIHLSSPRGPMIAGALIAQRPSARVVALAVADDESQVLAWARVGAAGCLHCGEPLANVVAAAERVSRGETVCSGALADTLFRRSATFAVAARQSASWELTRREKQILLMLAEGLSNKEIAAALHVEVPTVKTHLRNLYSKLAVHSREEVVKLTIPDVAFGT